MPASSSQVQIAWSPGLQELGLTKLNIILNPRPKVRSFKAFHSDICFCLFRLKYYGQQRYSLSLSIFVQVRTFKVSEHFLGNCFAANILLVTYLHHCKEMFRDHDRSGDKGLIFPWIYAKLLINYVFLCCNV